jgi:hypothetical protein
MCFMVAPRISNIKHSVVQLMSVLSMHNWTRYVTLAKHWLWLPDDGSYVNQNMLEQIL